MSSTPNPLYRLASDARRAQARRFVGQLVAVTYSGQRDPAAGDVVYGEVLGVARPLTGAQADELALRTVAGELVTLSLATVVVIENPDERLWAAVTAQAAHAQTA